MGQQLTVVEARPADVPRLVGIHMEALPRDYLPRLGRHFLQRYFFPYALDAGGARTFVCREREVLGFITVCADGDRFTRGLTRYRPLHLMAHVARASWRSSILWHSLEALVSDPGGPPDVAPELYLIAVAPTARRRGVGGALVLRLAEYLTELGHQRCRVKVVMDDVGANAFYERQGFHTARTARYHGRHWNWRVADLGTVLRTDRTLISEERERGVR
jgi:ribosomal protein S18 acetylase RimI-like enzyme